VFKFESSDSWIFGTETT